METEAGLEAEVADQTSLVYLGQWQRLVSTTNWEKGRIIQQWRQALVDSGANWQQYSDEAWSRRVGNVTGQHVGRLRRVYERFGEARETYPGLYWSHFQAALDWPDAEMWLEGAVQSGWSISEMRHQRWQAFGGDAAEQPDADTVVEAELDEDFSPPEGRLGEVRSPASGEAVDFNGSAGDSAADTTDTSAGVPFDPDFEGSIAGEYEAPVVRPFERLAELPDDVGEAFEAFKLAILRHKLAGWLEISRDDLLGSLEALKQLALAPPAG
jgi:hypothetical protein